MSAPLADARRLVVKIGSALLVDPDGRIRTDWLSSVAAEAAARKAAGCETLIVSSGAVAAGRRILGYAPAQRLRLEEKQAAAAVGQIELIGAWSAALRGHGAVAAQTLLTVSDTETGRRRYLNARTTIETLLGLGAVPVVNENDTIATNELRYGDNDRLAARVAQLSDANALVLLSDIDGLYDRDPRSDSDANHIPEVRSITPDIHAMAGEAPPGVSTGGMVTKIAAAEIATRAGCRMAIAKGEAPSPLTRIGQGERCTWFLATQEPRTARKQWIAGHLKTAGAVTVDDGAALALTKGASLLPVGVIAVEGRFERGDVIAVKARSGQVLGRALSAYDASDAERIRGRKSDEIEAILGYAGREALAHRDDMALD